MSGTVQILKNCVYSTGSCRAFNGSFVEDGEEFQPNSDPCVQCLCDRGRKGPCRSIACQPPDCPNPKPIPGLCCSFTCQEPGIDPAFVKGTMLRYHSVITQRHNNVVSKSQKRRNNDFSRSLRRSKVTEKVAITSIQHHQNVASTSF